jgi:hypothetical protein
LARPTGSPDPARDRRAVLVGLPLVPPSMIPNGIAAVGQPKVGLGEESRLPAARSRSPWTAPRRRAGPDIRLRLRLRCSVCGAEPDGILTDAVCRASNQASAPWGTAGPPQGGGPPKWTGP